MENSTLDSNISEGISFTENMRSYLVSSAKWAKFLAILGFIYIGFMVIAAFSAGTLFSALGSMGGRSMGGALPGAAFTVTYLVVAVIYFFPILYMYKFATNALSATEGNDQYKIEESLHNLKRMYQFMGILTIIAIGVTIIAFLIAIVGAAVM
jgi:hypothetical protein